MATQEDRNSLGDYMLMESVGKGAFGVVFRALSKTKGAFFAIKKLSSKKEHMASLMTEIELLKSLSHKNIIKYIEHVATETHVYIVMEFIENGSLSSLVKKYGILPEALVCKYMSQVLEGLTYLHRQGVIHRDIKGANLLACTDGTIKLTDFGVSTRYDLLSKSKEDVAGTPNWMAPEIIQMQPPTVACDIWSVGITIIELLTGNPPYSDMAQQAAIYKIVMEDHPPLPPGISSALEDFLLQSFKKDENLRATAEQLLSHAWIKSASKRITIDSSGTPQTQNSSSFEQTKEEIVKFNQQLQTVARRASVSYPSGIIPPQVKAAIGSERGSMQMQMPKPRAFPKLSSPLRMDDFTEGLESDSMDLDIALNVKGTVQLKVQAWNDEAEPDFDDGAFDESPKEMDVERARQLLHKEIIAQLNHLSMSDPDSAIEPCDKLNEIFKAQPQETVVLVQPIVSMPFLQHMLKNELPVLSLVEILRKCSETNNINSKKRTKTVTAILRVINTASRNYEDMLSVLSSLQGIPLIAEFSRANHQYETRIEAANFLCFLGSHSIPSLQMLLSVNGLESVMALLLSPYSTSRELCHIAIDCLWSVISHHSPTARAPLSHVLLGYNVTELLTTVLHSMICGKDGIDENHLTKGIDTLLLLAGVGYLPLRKSLCTKSVLEKIQAMLKQASKPHQSKAVVSFLLSLLKVVHHVSSEQIAGDALEPVIDSLIPILGIEIPPGSGPKSRTSTEINNQILHILYNLCTLSPTRAARAANAGFVPLIHRSIREQWPMRELALPILFVLLRLSPRSRDLLWQSGSLLQFLDLLEDKSWYVEACDCISEWLQDDPTLVSPVLIEPINCMKIKNLFSLHGKDRTFSKVVPSILAMAKSSSALATALVQAGVMPDILEIVSQERMPFTRLTLLKLMLALYGNAKIVTLPPTQTQIGTPISPPPSPRVSHLAIPAVEDLAKNDPSELVRGVASDILALLKKREEPGSNRRTFLSLFRH